MSRVITTDDYVTAVELLVEHGTEEALESAELLYHFHGPFELDIDGDEPSWYDE